MRTLASAEDRASIEARLRTITAFDLHAWGQMSAHGAVCHLCDSYLLGLGEKQASDASNFLQRTVVKWVALNAPMQWPKGVPTRPEMEQGKGGTAPERFEGDRQRLLDVFNRFCENAGMRAIRHPIFGALTKEEWLRWGYLHADHHLRQFGR